MLIRQFIQYILGFVIFTASSFALSNTEFTYYIIDNIIDNGIELIGCAGTCPSDLVIPDTIDGNSVTSIGGQAFRHNQLTSVTIPNSVTSIGEWAFFNNQLTSVTIPDSVTSIGDYAFAFTQLTSVTIPDSVTSIEYSAFRNNQLTSVTFLGDRPEIGIAAFNYNIDLVTISYCTGATGWPGYAIEGITPQLDETCDSDGDGINNTQDAFPFDATNLLEGTEFTYNVIDDGIEVTGCVGGCSTDLVIPDEIDGYRVAAIGDDAFENNYFSELTLPSGLERVGRYAFSQNQLTNVTIPDSVSYIGDRAFADNQITTVTFPDSVKIIGDGAFHSNQLTSVTIPDDVTTIGWSAFADNQLNTVTIGNSVTSIRDLAFSYNQLTSVSIPDKVSFIGRYAFLSNQLTNLIFSGEPPTIGNNAFSNNSLTSITYCQNESDNWDGVIIEGITPQFDENCFNSTTEYSVLDIDQSGSVDALTDGLILLRYFFGLRGDNLINGTIATDANRTTAEDIEEHIQSLLP